MKAILSKIRQFSSELSENNVSAHAAAGAFYMFLSLVPFLGLLTSIIPYTNAGRDYLLNTASKYIPGTLQEIIADIINDIFDASKAVLPISFLLTVWLSRKAFSAIIRGIEDISGCGNYSSYFKRNIRACIYALGIAMSLLAALSISFFGEKITFFSSAVVKLRFLFAAIFLAGIFLLIYRWVPGMKLRFTALLPGALSAAVALLLFTWLYSEYILYGNSYSTYGHLAAIAVSLLWMYWCIYIILIGAQLNMFISGSEEG